MKFLRGKWFIALRFKNDLCIGVGRPPTWMRKQALADRPHFPARLPLENDL